MRLFLYLRLILLSLLSLGLLVVFEFGISPIPPLGNILSPFHGLFQNSPDLLEQKKSLIRMKGIKERVQVTFDENAIPHVFASNLEDLYFMQGYLQARDRLFQMDMITRLTAGRVSEFVGERALKTDMFFVSIGLRESAEKILALMMQDDQTKLALSSFIRGVNIWISGLSDKQMPFEYKLLGVKPEKWNELRTVHLLLAMSYFLSGQTYDPLLSFWAKTIGVEKIKEVFPLVPPNTTPIFNSNSGAVLIDAIAPFETTFSSFPDWMLKDEGGASNSWAVGPTKSATGAPLLSNDTHLGYSYPNTWYEIHLNAPGINVYGATFPAAPGVIIGANNNVSWGVTNATIDVIDWLEVKLRKDSVPQYFYDNEWFSFKVVEHIIKVKGLRTKKIEHKVLWTHHGVVVHQTEDAALVLRWLPHTASNTLKVFLQLNQAKDYSACKFILREYEYPAQNFLCADSAQVGGRQNGKAPLREAGEGRFILDGSDPKNDWSDWVPWEELPYADGAEYIATANQHAYGSNANYYLNWAYEDSFRGERIYNLLKSKDLITAQDFELWHNDIYDLLAEQAIKALEKDFDSLSSKSSLSDNQKKIINGLLNWNFENTADSVAGATFLVFWEQLKKNIWLDQLPPNKGNKTYPSNKVLIQMLKEDLNKTKNWSYWFDNISTPESESRVSNIEAALKDTEEILTQTLGPDYEKWILSDYKILKLEHLAKLPGFGSKKIEMGGSASTLNANRSITGSRNAGHGAVWRMVVEMSNPVKIKTNYPGGPSGNPFDERYESFTNNWVSGKLRDAVFVDSPSSYKKWKGELLAVPE